MSGRVIRVLYRALLCQARLHEQNPCFKSYLASNKLSRVVGNPMSPQIIPHHQDPSNPRSLHRELWTKFVSGDGLYIPKVDLEELVRTEFRRSDSTHRLSERVRFAFEVLRTLNFNANWFHKKNIQKCTPGLEFLKTEKYKYTLDEKFRTPNVPGSILVAHPRADFAWASALVLMLRELPTTNFYEGVIVNKIYDKKSEIVIKKSQPFGNLFLNPPFDTNPVFYGGPMHKTKVYCLHPFMEFPEAKEVIEGVAVNFLDSTKITKFLHDYHKLAEEQKVSPEQFHFILGAAVWYRHRLRNEMDAHYWFNVVEPAAGMRELVFGKENGAKKWARVVHSFGGEYQDFAKLLKTFSAEQTV